MLGRSMDEWIAAYARSHQHRVNRLCHTVGIPLVVLSLVLAAGLVFAPRWWPLPAAMFVLGWTFQFIGHYFEGKPPEFFRDWRFLLVGLRWWLRKVSGRA